MSDETKALVPIDPSSGQLAPTDLEGMWRIASIMAESGMVPSDYAKKPEKCFVAMQLGMEVGLGYMAAIQTISVINGKPALYGDGVPAIVQSRGKCKKWDEHFELDEGEAEPTKMKHYRGGTDLNQWPDDLTAVCILEREGFDEPFEGYFSVADARRMGKWNTPESTGALSVWQKYPLRMLKMRARGFATRDGFSDHLKGIGIVEDLMDVSPIEVVSTVVEKKDGPVDPMDEILKTDGDGQIIDVEPEVVEAPDSTQEEESPQESTLSEPEAAKQAAKHPLVVHLEGLQYSPYLIDQFVTWAAENNEMDLVSLMNEAMSDLPGFEEALKEYADENKIEYANQASSPSPEIKEIVKDANEEYELAAAIDESAAACEAAGATLDASEVPETDRKLATGDGVIDQDGEKVEPVSKEDLDPNADIEGWVSRFEKQYRLKNKHQYSPFVLANEVKFRQLFSYAPTIYDKAINKWTRFYGDEPWPVVLEPERDQVDSKPEAGDKGTEVVDPVHTEKPKSINEAARLFKDEEKINHTEKLARMKRLWPTELGKVLTALKMGNGSLSEAAVEVISFALKEEIAKTQAKEKKGKK